MPGHATAAYRLACLLVPAALMLASARSTQACSLDGVASLSVNGNLAGLTNGPATRSTLAHWAPFTLIAAAPGDTLHLREDIGNVRRSIPGEALKAPFYWTFGDGTTATGQTATHRYTRTGWYKITVAYYRAANRTWVTFDDAQMQIVSAGSLWRANLGYYARQDAQVAIRWIIWLAVAGLGGLVVWRRMQRAKA